jgi:hypothetical protein
MFPVPEDAEGLHRDLPLINQHIHNLNPDVSPAAVDGCNVAQARWHSNNESVRWRSCGVRIGNWKPARHRAAVEIKLRDWHLGATVIECNICF